MSGLFWRERLRQLGKGKAAKRQTERFASPEETGRRLVVALRAWLGRALEELPPAVRPWYRIELEPPVWLDPGHPPMALNECRRLVLGIPPARPGDFSPTPEQERALAVLHGARAAVHAVEGIQAARALVVLDRAIGLGVNLARAHVEPWEPCAATGQKVQQAAREGHESTHGTPEEKAERWAEYQRAVDAILERAPHLSLTDARNRAARELKVSYSTIRRHTADPRK